MRPESARPTPDSPPGEVVEPVAARVRRFSAAHGQELTVGDVRWRYYRLGAGPPVVWLTGGLPRAALGFSFLDMLGRSHTIVAPDYPPLRSFDEFDAGLSEILRTEGVERFDLAGQSCGGLLAQAVLARHPQAVDRLVLSSSGPGNYGRAWLSVSYLAIQLLYHAVPVPSDTARAWNQQGRAHGRAAGDRGARLLTRRAPSRSSGQLDVHAGQPRAVVGEQFPVSGDVGELAGLPRRVAWSAC